MKITTLASFAHMPMFQQTVLLPVVEFHIISFKGRKNIVFLIISKDQDTH